MGPKQDSQDKVIVDKLNSLLDQLHVPSHVESLSDISAGVFVTLYEGLCGEQLSGIIRSPKNKEDEIQNCQTVIDSLSGDVLHTSLTHISGAEIMNGSQEDILNLIEIFSGLLEYMLNKIESDVSTDNDDIEQNLTTDDPDLMTQDQLDEILEAELKKDRLEMESTAVKNAGPTAKWVADASPSRGHAERTADLIDAANGISPVKNGRDTTADLIRETEEIEKRLQEATNLRTIEQSHPQYTGPAVLSQLDTDAVPTASVNEPISTEIPGKQEQVEEKTDGLVRERETRDEIIRRLENDPRYKYMLPPSKSQTQEEDKEIDETFTNLQHMVEETAAMARAAVDCSPSRAKSMLETLDRTQRRTRAIGVDVTERSRRDQPRRGDVTSAKRASPSARGGSKPSDKLSDTELTPSKAKRKVSFLVERSMTDSSPSIIASGGVNRRYAWEESESSIGKNLRPKSGSFPYDLSNKENDSYEERLRKQYEDIISDVDFDADSPDKYNTASSYRTNRYKELSSRPKALYTMGDTRKLVHQEKEAGKKKIGFLQKIYREDLDEMLDEAEYLMKKNREAAQEQEKEYRKKMQAGIKSKTISDKQGSSVLKKTTKKVPPKTYVSSKVKKSSNTGSIVKQNKSLTIKDDEDILPMLLDEFPHLHLSLHTWHELWRKGLTQIEQITRSHQEVRRKKSRAQNQLEEAEKRQEIMVNIMKKELEHSQRLKEIKDRQAVAIKTKNKLHERRMQSAKSRHYYDEYQVRMRAKMLKRRTREEMIFKKLFKDGLEIQKERIRELRKYAREQRDGQAKSQRDEIDSIENYYRDQFQMLAENIAKEKEELEMQEKAKQKVLTSMKKDLRKKMESEIKLLQDHLVRDDDDAYFRQLDADRVVHDLKMAKYQVLTSMKKDLRKKMESEIKLLQDHLVRDDDDAYFRQLDADRVVHDLKMAKYQVRV